MLCILTVVRTGFAVSVLFPFRAPSLRSQVTLRLILSGRRSWPAEHLATYISTKILLCEHTSRALWTTSLWLALRPGSLKPVLIILQTCRLLCAFMCDSYVFFSAVDWHSLCFLRSQLESSWCQPLVYTLNAVVARFLCVFQSLADDYKGHIVCEADDAYIDRKFESEEAVKHDVLEEGS